MGFWAKSRLIFNFFRDHTKTSIRHIAVETGLSKSSVHRLRQALERRDVHPESWLWETAEGRSWLVRLVVASLYIFGFKRGVGADTISEFLRRLRLEAHVGSSPSALRGLMEVLEPVLLETAAAWEREGIAAGEIRPIIGAVDETFLERMMLVFMDLASGYLLVEEVAADRSYDTWYAVVKARLTMLGTGVRYLVSDRAKALIKLAETGLACLSIPDLFHLMHDLTKSYSLAICQSSAPSAADFDPSARASRPLPGVPSRCCCHPARAGAGGGTCSGGATLAACAQHLSEPPGAPVAHHASVARSGCGVPDVTRRGMPDARGGCGS